LKKIGSLPSAAKDAYETILARNGRDNQEEAKIMLQIVGLDDQSKPGKWMWHFSWLWNLQMLYNIRILILMATN
jgi:hypothetical protein